LHLQQFLKQLAVLLFRQLVNQHLLLSAVRIIPDFLDRIEDHVLLLRGQGCEYVFNSGCTPGGINVDALRVDNFTSVSVEDVRRTKVGATFFVLAGVVHMDFTGADVSAG
jgi:hypothetical protein